MSGQFGTNKDGAASRQEFVDAPRGVWFDQIDKSKDGTLSSDQEELGRPATRDEPLCAQPCSRFFEGMGYAVWRGMDESKGTAPFDRIGFGGAALVSMAPDCAFVR